MEEVYLEFLDENGYLIDAMGYTGENILEILHFVGVSGFLMDFEDDGTLYLHIMKKELQIKKTWYVYRNHATGEYDTCTARVFNASFKLKK